MQKAAPAGFAKMNATDTVIHFIQTAQWEHFPEPVKHQSKRCLLDGLGALLAGTQTPAAQLMAQFATEQFKGDAGAILGRGARASLVGAALANGFAANALDIDDGHRLIKGHPGACVLPPALVAGEAVGCSGKAFLTALIVGYEVGIRAGLIRHAVSETYHSSGSWGAVAGAAVAGKLYELGVKTIRHVLGAAEYHAPIAPMMKGIDTPCMGKDSIGWGCMVAMSSALMGQKGFTGVQPLFDETPEPAWIDALGQTYEILNLYFKPYCVCRWAQPAIEGAFKIIRTEDLPTQEIAQITVRTFAEAAALAQDYPETTENAQYNIAFGLAAALFDGEVGPQQVAPPRIFDRDIHALMDKVEVKAASVLQERFPREALAEVQIETKSGAIFKSGIMAARWEPASGLPTNQELIDKFDWLAAPVVGVARAREIKAMVWRLENVADVQRLIRLCV